MKTLYILLILAASVISLSGQQTFSGPASGYVFDSVQQSIRPILGVPGASWLGVPSGSPSGQQWDSVSVAPNGKRGLGISGLSINLIPDLSQPAGFTSIAETSGPVSRIMWSADSTTAAIWAPTTGQLQRITSLDSTPVVHASIDLTVLSGVLSGWNLSPDGNYVALSGPALGRASVFLCDQDAAPAPIGYLSDPGAVAFSADSKSLFVVNGAKHQIAILDLSSGAIDGAVDASPFAGGASVPETGNRNPRTPRRPVSTAIQDLAVSADGSKLYAMAGETICGFDLSAGNTPSCSSLDVAPRSFQSMPGGMLLLNYSRAGNMPLWLLDGKTGQTWFVPAGSTAANASL
jgi:hypothetical protein